jgi:Notch 1
LYDFTMPNDTGSSPRPATPWVRFALCLSIFFAVTYALPARAYINQVDGTVLPVTTRLQQCLDGAAGEGVVGAIDAIAEAAVIPEAYRPVLHAASGHHRVTFVDIGEGAGYRNSFGWFWVGEDVTDTANLHTIFGCRTYGQCDCPCATTRTVTIDFDTQPGFAAGRPIGFWLRTPQRLAGTNEDGTFDTTRPYCTPSVGCDPTTANFNDSCGGRLDSNNRIYFTSKALNDDGDYVHFLVYTSVERDDTFYFGFEDLFRGGDNDFEDMLTRASGLVPLCDPQPETCDNVDQDCDGNIDEGLVRGCATACGAGTETCATGIWGTCTARIPAPTETVCDAVDDDCDGPIDEGLSRACSSSCGSGTEICSLGSFIDCSAPTPRIETCNNGDDDCDGMVDESITRPCASICGSGIETCVEGSYEGCTAPTPGLESCDNTDEDCDGLTDEDIRRDCSNVCGAGTEVCISGTFVGCTAPSGSIESCNNDDDDCDGLIDEGITRACSTECGVGSETCTAGVFGGCDAPLPMEEVCNNLDDDCNGVIDDGNPGGGGECIPFGDGGFADLDGGGADAGAVDMCAGGRIQCVAGALVCRGGSTSTREICNCLDDDCDGTIDEDSDNELCPGGACIDCACASPCDDDEFPCPPGRECDRSLADPEAGIIGYCVPGRCADVVCTDEEVCNPDTGVCENRCIGVTCDDGFACVRGACVEDNCYGRGCPAGERCRDAACEADPCAGVTCDAGEYCREGACTAVCTHRCGEGETCVANECVPAPCGGCESTQSCVADECVNDTCTPVCGRGRICRGSACIDDPCRGIRCPDGASCIGEGQCTNDDAAERPEPDYGLAAGGLGCTCRAAGSGSPSSAPMFLVLGFIALAWMRRRGRARVDPAVSRAGLAAMLAFFGSGCEVDPFCFGACGDDAGAPRDGGRPDARAADGCVAVGDETCNENDDDCDGLIDEGTDTQTDPGNCGGCGIECNLPFAFPTCEAGECVVDRCEIGHHDIDDTPANGCEYECPPSGDELCDELDNDCDTAIDEDFDLSSDLGHCGECGNTCRFANAVARCEAGTCAMGTCNAGFVDLDEDPETGCEYRCTPGGAERCNRVDDDCDSNIDEGFDLASDPANCGECGRECNFPNATGSCAPDSGGTPVCALAACTAGFIDLDSDPTTGCEYACTPSGDPDECDGDDDDCDGRIDESDTRVGTPCGVTTGSCDPGITSCQLGGIVCVGGIGPQSEICNGADDDCDGPVDESTAGDPIPGVGDRCGETNVGACSFGTVQCVAASFVCGGAYVGPVSETCNGVDDDCDGTADDSLMTPAPATVPSCAETRGICAGRIPTCRGAGGWACDLPSGYQPIEARCDTFDNDCDGTADEGCLNPLGTTDTRIDVGDATSEFNSLAPYVWGDGADRLWITWMDLRLGRSRVYYNRTTDGGATFLAAPVRIDTAGGAAIGPRVVLSNTDDNSFVWSDFRGGTSYREIYARHSSDYGATFSATDFKVNPSGPTSTRDSFNVELARSGNNVYVVYEGFVSDRSRHVFFSRSTNGGSSFSAPVQVSTSALATFVAATPQIAAAGSNVYVVWRDNRNGRLDVFLRRSTDSGASFAGVADTRIDTGDTAGSNSSFEPRVAAEGTNVYVTWVDDRDLGSFDIWFNRSTDSGATWGTSAQLDADPFSHDSIEPHIVAPSAGVAVVAWIDYRSGFPDVLAARSSDSGASFAAPERVDTGNAPGISGAYELDLAANGSRLVAAWADDRSGFLDVYANYSLDGGVTWQPQDYRMDTSTIGTSDSQEPRVFMSTSTAHVVWVDHRLGTACPGGGVGSSCANGDIFYRRLR